VTAGGAVTPAAAGRVACASPERSGRKTDPALNFPIVAEGFFIIAGPRLIDESRSTHVKEGSHLNEPGIIKVKARPTHV
jgi:hypothetical protein